MMSSGTILPNMEFPSKWGGVQLVMEVPQKRWMVEFRDPNLKWMMTRGTPMILNTSGAGWFLLKTSVSCSNQQIVIVIHWPNESSSRSWQMSENFQEPKAVVIPAALEPPGLPRVPTKTTAEARPQEFDPWQPLGTCIQWDLGLSASWKRYVDQWSFRYVEWYFEWFWYMSISSSWKFSEWSHFSLDHSFRSHLDAPVGPCWGFDVPASPLIPPMFAPARLMVWPKFLELRLTGAVYVGNFWEWSIITHYSLIVIPATPHSHPFPAFSTRSRREWVKLQLLSLIVFFYIFICILEYSYM